MTPHRWDRASMTDVDLSYDVYRCAVCGAMVPVQEAIRADDVRCSEYGISYDCDEQVVKAVLRD